MNASYSPAPRLVYSHHKMLHYLHSLTSQIFHSFACFISNGSLFVTPYDKVQLFDNHVFSLCLSSAVYFIYPGTLDLPHTTFNLPPIFGCEDKGHSI